jgi:regulator of sigma E protease
MLDVIFSLVVFVIVLGLVIFIHELGHFIMAKRANILCHEFSLGMGPILWSKRVGETLYAIRAVPIGGYVMMSGEEVDDEFIKIGQEVRLVFNEQNVVEKIVLDVTDERYLNYEKVTIHRLDLSGKNGNDLFVNEHVVKRDAFYVMPKRELQISPYDRGFNGKTKSERFLAIFAGPFMNFVLALFIFIIMNMIIGSPITDSTVLGEINTDYPAEDRLFEGDEIISIEGEEVSNWEDISLALNENVNDRIITFIVNRPGEDNPVAVNITPIMTFYSVGFHTSKDTIDQLLIEVNEGTIAYKAGLRTGDEIKVIDGEDVFTWSKAVFLIERNANLNNPDDSVDNQQKVPIVFEVLRDGELIEVTILEPLSHDLLDSQGFGVVDSMIGISPEFKFNLIGSFRNGFVNMKESALMIFTTLDLLFNSYEVSVGELAGPVGIYSITSSALKGGFVTLLRWIGLLSVNLGVINLLPIPALDGGRLVFLGYEAITTKKPNKRIENLLHSGMLMLLMGFFIFITYNDILRLFNLK